MSARNAGTFIIASLTPPCGAKCLLPSDWLVIFVIRSVRRTVVSQLSDAGIL